MIHWHEYKKYRMIAKDWIVKGIFPNDHVEVELLKFKLGKQTEEQTIENIIDYLSKGEHFKDNKFYAIK